MAVLKVKDGSSSWHNIDSIKGDKGDTGTSIVSVTKTGSQGLVDTYTILFSDNTTTTFQVKNGENGQGSGSVTSVDTGVGLTGGAITSSGTIKADLVSDTYSTEASEAITQTSGRQYAVNPDANGKLSVNVPWADTTYESKAAASGGTAVSLVTTGEKYNWNQAEPNVKSDWNATSGDAQILNKPTIPTVPTNVSAFTNDAGYLTSYTETDPTVPSWAKQSSKPTYTASEVGALPDTTSIPSKTSDLTNDSNFVADASYVHTDNNYTSTEKSKLSGIAAGAEVNVQSDWNQTTTTADDYIKNKPTIPTVPTNVSAFTNDAGYITGYTETDPVFSASAASDITSADITKLNGFNIATPKADADQYATFAELPLKAGTYVVIHANGTTADSDSPMPSYTGACWWNVVNIGTYPVGSYEHESEYYQRILQIASTPYNGVDSAEDIFYRVRHDDAWSGWLGLSALYQEPFRNQNYNSFAEMQSAIDSFATGQNHLRRRKSLFWCCVNYSGSDTDAPVTTSAAHWWNVLTFGENSTSVKRQTQIAFSCFNNRQHIYLRQWHDTTSYGWYDISPTGTPTTYNWTGYTLGDTSTSTSTGTYTYDDRLMELSLSSLRTGAQLTIGVTGYDVGTISPAPKGKVTCLAHRHDSGTQMGTIEITTSGTIKIYPLNTIPPGVEISAHVMYFHQ